MSFEMRSILPGEMDEYKRVAGTALVLKPTSFEGMRPEWTLCGYEDGKLTTSFAAWPLTMRFNRGDVPVSGVTAVGTLPPYRRHGHLRKIMTKHFEALHDQGERSMAILWASWAAIYQRYGYAVVSTRYSYFVEPRYVQFAFPQKLTGGLREAGTDEFQLLVDLYRRFREDRTGYLHRGRAMWDAGILGQVPPGGTVMRTVYEEEGVPQGYMVTATTPVPGDIIPGHRITVRDLIWLTSNAYRALWENLANMDLIQEILWPRAPADDPLPHLILEPRRLKATAADCLLARLVDVAKALTQRTYQTDGELTFELADDMCPWNRGRWKLETSEKGSMVTATRQTPQVKMPVSTLALLLFGQISATEAARMGRLDAPKPEALPAWDNVMRTLYRPTCPDMF
jgi:predicted acetyltransferase